MDLHHFEAQWEQFKASIETRRQIHIDSYSQTKHGDPDKSTDNQERKYRLPLDYIKDSLDKWDRDKG